MNIVDYIFQKLIRIVDYNKRDRQHRLHEYKKRQCFVNAHRRFPVHMRFSTPTNSSAHFRALAYPKYRTGTLYSLAALIMS